MNTLHDVVQELKKSVQTLQMIVEKNCGSTMQTQVHAVPPSPGIQIQALKKTPERHQPLMTQATGTRQPTAPNSSPSSNCSDSEMDSVSSLLSLPPN